MTFLMKSFIVPHARSLMQRGAPISGGQRGVGRYQIDGLVERGVLRSGGMLHSRQVKYKDW